MCGLDVYGLKRMWVLSRIDEFGMAVEGREIEEKENQAIFATVVRQ